MRRTPGRWFGNFKNGAGVLALTFVVGLLQPAAIRPAWAQSATPFDLIGDQTPVSLTGQLQAHDPTVGVVGGSGGTSGGAATYDIPIVVPPGRRGMQPSLSLSYSSRAGNGIAGMGWSLSGLSSLHRCPMTLAQDGQIRAVQMDAGDKLCLDGQRLVLTSGVYGTVGATYGTELDSFVRVTQYGGDLVGNTSYFKVERKSGEVAWYGNTSSGASVGRVIPGGLSTPLSWLPVVTLDRSDNAMHYGYTDYGNGETLINHIWYTGTSAVLGNRHVAFTYADRPQGAGINDRSSSYLAGGLTRQTKRLTAVTTFVDTTPVRSFTLNYGSGVSAGTGRSLLQSVSDCAYDGTNWICKSPTTFAWQQGAARINTSTINVPSLSSGPVTGIDQIGDVDGDGSSEVIMNNGLLVSFTPERTVRWSMQMPSTYQTFKLDQYADFNQDGRVDFIGRDTTTNTFVIRSWSGSPTDTNFATAFGNTINTGIVANGSEWLRYVGDMDGDGRADIVLQRTLSSNAGSCSVKIYVYRNTGTSASAPTFAESASHCLYVPHVGWPEYEGEELQSVRDFDGDGLPDILVGSTIEFWYTTVVKGRRLQRILFGNRSTAGYSLVAKDFSTLFQSAYPQSTQEGKKGLFTMWADVNGDGLQDWLYVGSDGQWKLRYNRGGVLGQMYGLGTAAGLAGCGNGTSNSGALCADTWQPWQAAHISVRDTDGDGRAEILYPAAFAANVCILKPIDYGACPGGDGTGLACQERWICPEDPSTAQSTGLLVGVTTDQDGNGVPESEFNNVAIGTHLNGFPDYASYKLHALRISEAADGTPVVADADPGIISGGVDLAEQDLYGDGRNDSLFLSSPRFGDRSTFGILTTVGGVAASTTLSPRTLPNNLPILTDSVLINEDTGPAGQKNPDGITPQTDDVLAVVTDGFGQQIKWSYSPLAGKAGRTAGMTPLYTVPMAAAQRYIDEQHIYFTSSMSVVSDMTRSDGIGGFRSWRYGYAEAMYNNRGRGFQGFRTIVEEDVSAGLRTTTTYHQKFPLTSQVDRVVVNPISRTGEDGAISRTQNTWRCNRANRADTAACTATPGVLAQWFPFLDTSESWTYDATTAASGGTPAVLGYTQTVAASDGGCGATFATASGYDAYGNLTAKSTRQRDLGSGTAAGTSNRLDLQCVSENTTFVVDTVNWWLDKVTHKDATTQVTWDAANQPLPAGASVPSRTVTTDYVWNADRTLSTETVQAGVANQQRVTAYTYPATNNYGLPTGVAVSASGDPQSPRSTGTTYSADGYFPQVAVNALGHSATTSVRASDGQPTSVTDPNGLRTLIDYDAFGTVVKKRFRGATDSVYVAPDQLTAIARCTPSNCWNTQEAYQVMVVQDGAPTHVERHDPQGRIWVSANAQQDGVWSYQMNTYDTLGRHIWESSPFRSNADLVWTSYIYNDILGRMTRKVVPKQGEDGRGDMVTTYAYNGRTTAIHVAGTADAPGVQALDLSRTTDSLGRYVETMDAQAGRTRFWYESNGNVAAIEDAKGVTTKAFYNVIGQRTSVNDPNQGAWSFAYNALGEVTSQTDARGVYVTFGYDKLGRPLTRGAHTELTGDTTLDYVLDSWTYDPVNAKGAVGMSQRTVNGDLERRNTGTYDALARPIQSDIVQAQHNTGSGVAASLLNYRLRTKYDSYYGRPVGTEFPNGEAVQVLYSSYGHGIAEKDPQTGVEYRRTNSTNARGQALQETFGNGVVLSSQYQLQTGQLTQLAYSQGASGLRKLGYGYDVFGNLKRQSLNDGASREDYSYDTLQRLVTSIRSGAASGTVNYAYDSVGNFTSKSDFSTTASSAYSYSGGTCGGGANAVKSVALAAGGTRTYCYDANGNLTGDNAGLAIQYDHQNLTVKATRGAQTDNFRYGPDGQRTRSWGSDGSRIYLPGYEVRTDTGETKAYVGDYAVITRTSTTRKVEYLLKDRLGSVDAVASSTGAITETRGYDAFGKPRSGNWADLTPAKLGSTSVTPKGFTQHEHLNQLELIHMNGRVYDYALGRFFGVDPFIQFPLNSQSLNPYSYILNNPLSGTDPSGYKLKKEDYSHIDGSICNGRRCTYGAGGYVLGSGGPVPVKAETACKGSATSCASMATSTRNITIRDGDGSLKSTSVTMSTNPDGTHSYGQVGGTRVQPNGARAGQRAVVDDPEGDIRDDIARDFGVPAIKQVDFGKGAMRLAYELNDPCAGATTTGGCVRAIFIQATAGRVLGFIAKRLPGGRRLIGDAAAFQNDARVMMNGGGGDYVSGFRAVSESEVADIAETGAFRPHPGGRSMDDKWFSETRQGAEQFMQKYDDLTEVVEARVPRDVYDRSYKVENIDGTGPGFCVQCDDLPSLQPVLEPRK